MKNEENGKKIWETPEVFDLDVEKTAGGTVNEFWEDTAEGVGNHS
ncbi:MAG: hypothetical protein PHF34_05385 [Bacteroidales bacterium]|nr:hypothetical protein [Bacteroidales bacterium]